MVFWRTIWVLRSSQSQEHKLPMSSESWVQQRSVQETRVCGSRWLSSLQDTRRSWKPKSVETVVAVYLHRYFGSLFYITIISLICFTLKGMFNYFVLLLVCDLMTTRILISPFRWFLSYLVYYETHLRDNRYIFPAHSHPFLYLISTFSLIFFKSQ